MKAMKYFLTAALAVLATGASAQFTNGGSSSASGSGTGLVKDCTPYSRLYVSYNPQTIKYDFDNVDDLSLTGFSVGYTYGLSVSKELPLFVELGARFNYSFKNEDVGEDDYYDEGELKTKYMNLAVPVNLAYKLTLPNGKVSITPFVGLTFKYNIKAESKYEPSDEASEWVDEVEIDYFDKDDMDGDDNTWSRFQVGWQIGAGLSYNSLYVGLHYGADFGEVAKKTKISNWGLSVGVNF